MNDPTPKPLCANLELDLLARPYTVTLLAFAVVDDLLHAFLGLDGKYIRAHTVKRAQGEHIVFAVDAPMDPSIREMAARMLPLWCA